MNENIDLTKILENCPKGTKLYSTIHGEVEFQQIRIDSLYPIDINLENDISENLTSDGKLLYDYNGECILFPSKEQRDWSKFTAPWYKKEKFDPKTLQPYEKVLVRTTSPEKWSVEFFSYYGGDELECPYKCIGRFLKKCCIPYNDETKHLVGTTDEAPEYYRYWED